MNVKNVIERWPTIWNVKSSVQHYHPWNQEKNSFKNKGILEKDKLSVIILILKIDIKLTYYKFEFQAEKINKSAKSGRF